MKRLILAAMLATGIAGAAHADDALKSAIAGEHRAAANKARDAFRRCWEPSAAGATCGYRWNMPSTSSGSSRRILPQR